jgi:hypothetical protein
MNMRFRSPAFSPDTGAVLLEVILALVLFVAAATILTSGLSASLDQVERLRMQTHAADLAVSVFSEIQLGTKTLALSGPQPFEKPFEDWTWEAVALPAQTEPDEPGPFKKIEVIIRHDDPVFVHRLTQVVVLDPTRVRLDTRPGIDGF